MHDRKILLVKDYAQKRKKPLYKLGEYMWQFWGRLFDKEEKEEQEDDDDDDSSEISGLAISVCHCSGVFHHLWKFITYRNAHRPWNSQTKKLPKQ